MSEEFYDRADEFCEAHQLPNANHASAYRSGREVFECLCSTINYDMDFDTFWQRILDALPAEREKLRGRDPDLPIGETGKSSLAKFLCQLGVTRFQFDTVLRCAHRGFLDSNYRRLRDRSTELQDD